MIYEYLLLINTMIINFKIFMQTKKMQNKIRSKEEKKKIINKFINSSDATGLVKCLKNSMKIEEMFRRNERRYIVHKSSYSDV